LLLIKTSAVLNLTIRIATYIQEQEQISFLI